MKTDTSLIKLRHELHQYPELSGIEFNTAKRIKKFIEASKPDEIVEGVGGTGILFVFNGIEKGPTVAIRSELDALPITEINKMAYKSTTNGVSHKCGHDGHMTIVAGIGAFLAENKLKRGRVILLFQPAEETGEGAARFLADEKFLKYKVDYSFALHNLPGYPLHQIVIREGTFASASKGLIVKLEGKTSHAAEPENGKSPALAMSKIVQYWYSLSNKTLPLSDFGIITVVHAQLGNKAFGVSPGQAHVMATIRAYNDSDLSILQDEALKYADQTAREDGLKLIVEETEVFAATINSKYCYEIVAEAAKQNGFETIDKQEPFRWSEDFGLFTQINGAMFGLGAGLDCPDLHNPDYDFPDEIINTGVTMFKSIIDQILN